MFGHRDEIELAKQHAEKSGYSGFSVYEGVVYFKKANHKLTKEELKFYPFGTNVFFLREDVEMQGMPDAKAALNAGTMHESNVELASLRYMQMMVHPSLADMEEPSFMIDSFCSSTLVYDIRAVGTDRASKIGSLAQHYADLIRADCSIKVAEDASLTMAAVSLALHIVGSQKLVLKFSGRDRDSFLHTWKTWRDLANQCQDTINDVDQLSGSYAWLKEDNSPMCRLARLACTCATLKQILHNMFSAQGSSKLLSWKNKFTRVDLTESDDSEHCRHVASNGSVNKSKSKLNVIKDKHDRTVLEIAEEQVKRRYSVALVNAASAYQVGGGFLTGGRHALEEAVCTQTTVFPSLLHAKEQARSDKLQDRRGKSIHIPEDGVILSRGVHMLRGATETGYRKLFRTQELAAVISVAMPNRNLSCKDSEYYPMYNVEEYRDLISKKMQMVLHGAVEAKAEILIMPDVGCGLFKNDPEVVGRVFGKVLSEFPDQGSLKEVILAGAPQFCDAVLEVCRSEWSLIEV